MKWTTIEDNILKLNYETLSKEELLDLLPNRTWDAIQLRAKRTFYLNRESFKKHFGNSFAKGLKHSYKPKHIFRTGKGEYISGRGYKYIQTGDISSNTSGWSCYKLEHVYIMEEFLGRKLNRNSKGSGEGIHHIDGNKLNNDLDNLLLYNNEIEHKNLHNQLQEIAFKLIELGVIKFNKTNKKYYINE
jgi:hypothetical protein